MVDEAGDISKKECEKLSGRRAVFCGFEQNKLFTLEYSRKLKKPLFILWMNVV